jgi:ABC-type lipoprotein export system ATPase subunit
MSDTNTILRAEGVFKSYRMGQSDVKVLKGANLSIERGEFIGIIGASGSGKSTLLHILGALDRPDRGVVSYNGRDLNTESTGTLNKFRNETIGFVFQFYHLLDELNVLENVLLPKMAGCSALGWLVCRTAAKKRAKELLEEFGLGERINHKPYQLSGGERQRVAIARALMNEPEILLADEPTGNLDSETGNGILEVLRRLHDNGQIVVMVTHDDKVAEWAGRVIRLVDGVVEEETRT